MKGVVLSWSRIRNKGARHGEPLGIAVMAWLIWSLTHPCYRQQVLLRHHPCMGRGAERVRDTDITCRLIRLLKIKVATPDIHLEPLDPHICLVCFQLLILRSYHIPWGNSFISLNLLLHRYWQLLPLTRFAPVPSPLKFIFLLNLILLAPSFPWSTWELPSTKHPQWTWDLDENE